MLELFYSLLQKPDKKHATINSISLYRKSITPFQGELLNIYDTKVVTCKNCGKAVGEIDYDTEIFIPKCGKCINQIPEGDKILYHVNYHQYLIKKKLNEKLLVEQYSVSG